MADVAIKPAVKRASKPGMVRCMVSLTQAHYDKLAKEAAADSPVYPRPVNEWLSIQLQKSFEAGANDSK